ncbi:hypothetical protein AB0D13_02720 [Streptomyces sp. NPDC048430]|uniref:hypothetical protein n=1 Tax=Streptomyces sp. NPDC048430 TaxID=3155388 RepID=UPI0034337961
MKITACDLDKQTPAKTYTITAEGEAPVDVDLCGTHAAPIEELIQQAKGPGSAGQEADEPGPAPVPKRGPARKAVARKAAPAKKTAKKATASRGPKIMTLEEIEAQKKAKG